MLGFYYLYICSMWIISDKGTERKKLDGVASLIADPSQCNSTSKQNPHIQKNFWTNDVFKTFEIKNVLSLWNIVYSMIGRGIS